MKNRIKGLLKNKNLLFFLLILFVGILLRFYRFQNRLELSSDDTGDIMICRELLRHFQVPFVGAFSSAGPFMIGPIFYYFIMLSFIIYPFSILSPWIMTELIGLSLIVILGFCGYLIGGKRLALVTTVITCFSPQLVLRSIALTQHTYVAFAASLLIMSFLLFFKTKQIRWAFCMGIFIGMALSLHYQALNFLIFFFTVFFISGISFKKRIIAFVLATIGFLLVMSPMIIWDSQQQFASLRNILDYFFIAQYRIYVPNSWKLFLFTYIPSYWEFVVGGNVYLAGVIMFFIPIFFVFSLLQRKLTRPFIILGIIFTVLLIVNRYYRGERYEGYLIYFMPFVIIFSSWVINQIFFANKIVKKDKYLFGFLGMIFLLVIIILDFVRFYPSLGVENGFRNYKIIVSTLEKSFPNKTFSVYDLGAANRYQSYPLSLLLSEKDKINPSGVSIGLTSQHGMGYKVFGSVTGHDVVSLQNINHDKSTQWINVNPEVLYNDFQTWDYGHRLKANFSITKFVGERLRFIGI